MRVWSLIVAVPLLAACSGYDPEAGLVPRSADAASTPASDGGATGDPAPTDDDAEPAGDDAGPAGDDAAPSPDPTPPPPPPFDPFAGAPPFKAGGAVRSSITLKHLFKIGRNPSGEDCMACHDGSRKAPIFLFAGTVYTDSKGTTGAKGVEVRVVDASSQAWSTYSDNDGNFYVSALTNAKLPAHAGVRTAKGAVAMEGAVTKVGCAAAGCHDAKAQARVYQP